ncbi:MAG: NYN domain-containing protein [Bdellovibrionota bacterium]|nr:MAG: NYN domain-containing protein [Bdellovibrionota bacterium]
MSKVMKYEELGKGVVKRVQRREVGLFIDGISLDRAARRLNRRVDLAALVKGVTSGLSPRVARYYTLIPYEDDSRQRAFLDAVSRAGLTVVVKRLPPKGVNRQVSIDSEMAADIVAFALGHTQFRVTPELEESHNGHHERPSIMPFQRGKGAARTSAGEEESQQRTEESQNDAPISRIVTVVCPSRDLSYPISLVKDFGVDTVTADFGQFSGGDVLKSAAKWIDLSDSETIWMAS